MLSKTSIKRLDAKSTPFEVVDTGIEGFLLGVQPADRMNFYFSYRTEAGKRKHIKIGVFGSSRTATQARDDAMAFADRVSKRIDIQGEKLISRREAKEEEKTPSQSSWTSSTDPRQCHPLNTMRELCGHTGSNTTLRHAHLATDHKAEAVALTK